MLWMVATSPTQSLHQRMLGALSHGLWKLSMVSNLPLAFRAADSWCTKAA